jgi:hypothetical protein
VWVKPYTSAECKTIRIAVSAVMDKRLERPHWYKPNNMSKQGQYAGIEFGHCICPEGLMFLLTQAYSIISLLTAIYLLSLLYATYLLPLLYATFPIRARLC